MRVCPKCGDYSADDLLAFCLADGTPFVEVDPKGDSSQKASRVIEEKRKQLRKQNRSARWKLAIAMALTILVAVVLVSRSFTVETTPPPTPTSTPTPSPTSTPTPSPTSTPSPSPIPSPSPSPSPCDSSRPPAPQCRDAGNNREKELILAKFGSRWRTMPVADKAKLVNQHTVVGTPGPEVTLTAVEFETRITRACTAIVSTKYLWRVYKGGNALRPPQNLTADTRKQFTCSKSDLTWRCR